MSSIRIPRRNFLSSTLKASAVFLSPSVLRAPAIIRNYHNRGSLIAGVQIGVITYSYRSMPDQSAEATLQYVLDSGVDAVELMGGPAESYAGCPKNPVDHRALWGLWRKQRNGEALTDDEAQELNSMQVALEAFNQELAVWRAKVSMSKFEELKHMFKKAGVRIYGFKPSALGKSNTDGEMDYAFRAAKALGATHVTVEHPSDDDHTLKLGKIASKHKIYVAYHGHEQQTPTFWDTALAQSAYNAMNPDLGHYVAAGHDKPLELLSKYHERISSIHLKDRQTPANGKANLKWGSGDTPIADILRLIRDKSYQFPVTIELEYEIPEGSDAVKEVTRCLDFCRQQLS